MTTPERAVDVGKKATLGKWYDTHGPKLLAMLEHRLDRRAGPRRGADDVLHDTFVRAEQRWDDFARSGMTPFAWLYRLARDCLYDDHDYQHRDCRSVRKEERWPDNSSQQMVAGLFNASDSPSKLFADGERLQRLQTRMADTLRQLDPDDYEILSLRHVGELKPKQIGELLGIPANTASQRYSRARARLLELWIDRYGDEDLQP